LGNFRIGLFRAVLLFCAFIVRMFIKYNLSMSNEEDMLNSGDVMLKNDFEMANRINNYDHVESTVVKRDDKGNVTHQWT